MSTTADLQVLPGKIRKKSTRACDECRMRKRKCDGFKPCVRCVQLRSLCKYTGVDRRGGSTRQFSSLVTKAASDGQLSPSVSGWPGEAAEVGEDVIQQNTNEDGEILYLGKASSITFFRKAKTKILESHSSKSGSLSFRDQSFNQQLSTPLILPPLEIAEQLVIQYFEFSSPTYRFLHRPSVLHSLRILYDDYDHLNSDPAMYSIVFMCCAWAANSSSSMKGPHTGKLASERFYQAASQQLEMVKSNSLPALQASFMACLYLLFSSRINQAWAMMGIIVRRSQAIGLHRKTSHSSILQNELGKRTFWCIYILDRYLSAILGRPCALHDEDIDQDLPGNLDDDQISQSALLLSRQVGEYREMLAPIAHVKLAQIVGRILKDLYGPNFNSKTRNPLVPDAIGHELARWASQLPNYLSFNTGSNYPTEELPLKFKRQRIILHIGFLHATMLLYRPFLISSPVNSALYTKDYSARCVAAAFESIQIITHTYAEQEIAASFWFETYVGFCSVVIVYVYVFQHPEKYQQYVPSAEFLQSKIAESAPESAISSKYVVIMEELSKELAERDRQERPEKFMEMTDWTEFDSLIDIIDPSDFSVDQFRHAL
jgi:hypothetical protein